MEDKITLNKIQTYSQFDLSYLLNDDVCDENHDDVLTLSVNECKYYSPEEFSDSTTMYSEKIGQGPRQVTGNYKFNTSKYLTQSHQSWIVCSMILYDIWCKSYFVPFNMQTKQKHLI